MIHSRSSTRVVKRKRRGSVLMFALIALTLAGALTAQSVRLLVVASRNQHQREIERQLREVVEAARLRLQSRVATSSDYMGETFEVRVPVALDSADDAKTRKAKVEIRMLPPKYEVEPPAWRVQASYPVGEANEANLIWDSRS